VTAPDTAALSDFVGHAVTTARGEAVLSVVTALASAYKRGEGFTAGKPNSDVRAVILTASARLPKDPSQVIADKRKGPFSVSYRTGVDGWSTAELYVLNRYRERAR
jgi:hypothetical protein